MGQIRNRTVPFIAQKWAVPRVGSIYTIGSNKRVKGLQLVLNEMTFVWLVCLHAVLT